MSPSLMITLYFKNNLIFIVSGTVLPVLPAISLTWWVLGYRVEGSTVHIPKSSAHNFYRIIPYFPHHLKNYPSVCHIPWCLHPKLNKMLIVMKFWLFYLFGKFFISGHGSWNKWSSLPSLFLYLYCFSSHIKLGWKS